MPSQTQYVVDNFSITQKLFFLFGFCIGLFGTYYLVSHFYCYTGCICLFRIHFHHLYTGSIISVVFLVFWNKNKMNRNFKTLFFAFMLGFGLGMVMDDILDHFIFQLDPFEWFCGEYCHC